MKRLLSLSLIITLVLCAGCKKVPVTGRSQLSLVGNDQIFISSFQQYEQVKKEGNLINGTEDSKMVKEVGARIQHAVEQYFAEKGETDYLKDYQWEFNLLKDDATVNAWCMPGGKVAFYTGIMPICQDATGVAVVMGHEVAHAIANHGTERVSQQYAKQYGMTAVGAAIGASGTPAITGDLLMQGAGAATEMGMLAFSRKHESEADELGLYFMAMAGYDPTQAPEFWKRMSAGSGGGGPSEFFSTHPSDETRIADLNKNMPKALEYYKSNGN